MWQDYWKFCDFLPHKWVTLMLTYFALLPFLHSTPKATRQGMTSTPAPPASPVLSVDGTTPRGLPASNAMDGLNVVAKSGGTGGEQPLPSDVVKVFSISFLNYTVKSHALFILINDF